MMMKINNTKSKLNNVNEGNGWQNLNLATEISLLDFRTKLPSVAGVLSKVFREARTAPARALK